MKTVSEMGFLGGGKLSAFFLFFIFIKFQQKEEENGIVIEGSKFFSW